MGSGASLASVVRVEAPGAAWALSPAPPSPEFRTDAGRLLQVGGVRVCVCVCV